MDSYHYPKPFFRADRKVWMVQLHGRQITLGKDKSAAFKAYHELMQCPAPVASLLVVGIIEGFLEWCSSNNSPATYDWYKKHLTSFTTSLHNPMKFELNALKPFHVYQWADKHDNWSDNYRRGALIAVQRVFNWAEKVGHIERNPIRLLEKPTSVRRDQIVTYKHYQEMLALTKDQAFRDVLTFAWETGARPEEIVAIKPDQCNLQQQRIEIPPSSAKGKKKWRIIYLSAAATEIVTRRHKLSSNTLFVNTRNLPWNPYSTGCRFYRFEMVLGVRYALYAFRHTFATRMLEAGLDSLTVSALLGHSDQTMLSKVYSHIGDSFLLGELNKVSSSSTAKKVRQKKRTEQLISK